MSTGPSPEQIPEVIVAESEPLLVIPVVPAEEKRPFLSGLGVVLAWAVILGVVGMIVIGGRTRWSTSSNKAEAGEQSSSTIGFDSEPSSAPALDGKERMGPMIMDMQGRYLVGAASIAGNNAQFYAAAGPFNSGPMSQRIRFVILAGELSGPQEAIQRLSELDAQGSEEAKVRHILRRLYEDYSKEQYSAPGVTPADRQELDRLGWFGELALHPAASPDASARQAVIAEARKTFFALWAIIVLFGVLGFFGFFGLMALAAFALAGGVRSGLRLEGRYGGVYAETFALYFLLFVGLSLLVGSIGGNFLLMGSIATLLSLSAIVWPVIRGIPWRQVRQDIGLTRGRGILVEPFLGLAGYAMTMPILAVGVAIMFLLLVGQGAFKGVAAGPEAPVAADDDSEQSSPSDSPRSASPASNPMLPDDLPAHPLVFMDLRGWWNKLLIYFLACFVAPLVEETMFRGVLYRHLRGATSRLGGFLSIVVSGSIVSFIFAAIHPQGWIAIPALMGLAYGFTILREWRGTLIPGMVAHGLNNGIVFTVAMMLLGS
jgi:membrane protease YdiL (CAAX protease family)